MTELSPTAALTALGMRVTAKWLQSKQKSQHQISSHHFWFNNGCCLVCVYMDVYANVYVYVYVYVCMHDACRGNDSVMSKKFKGMNAVNVVSFFTRFSSSLGPVFCCSLFLSPPLLAGLVGPWLIPAPLFQTGVIGLFQQLSGQTDRHYLTNGLSSSTIL